MNTPPRNPVDRRFSATTADSRARITNVMVKNPSKGPYSSRSQTIPRNRAKIVPRFCPSYMAASAGSMG